MPDAITVQPFASPFVATLTPPGSKSLSNRALILAALADGTSTLTNVLASDDTRVMLQALDALGIAIERGGDSSTLTIRGDGGAIPAGGSDLFCGNSGTTIRFLTAMCCLGHGPYRLSGVPRMHQRPIGQQVTLLRNLGARIAYEGVDGYPPLVVHARGLAGGMARFDAGDSSQFLSAVLMAAPYARQEVQIGLEPNQTSWPYVAMTMQLMDHFGVTCELLRDPRTDEPREVIVPQGVYRPADYQIEPDASAATYFLAAAAVRPGASVTIAGLGKRSLQGDVKFAEVLGKMGARVRLGLESITVTGTPQFDGIDADLSSMPDAAMTLAAAAVNARGKTTIRGLHTLRVKETDRLAALQTELRKLGATVDIVDNALLILPPARIAPAEIETYDDHRMAMSFAVIGTLRPGITIRDPGCVSKTYPGFWADLDLLDSSRSTTA